MRRHGTWKREVIRLPTGRWVELARWNPDSWWKIRIHGEEISLILVVEAIALLAIAAWGWLAP